MIVITKCILLVIIPIFVVVDVDCYALDTYLNTFYRFTQRDINAYNNFLKLSTYLFIFKKL